MQASAIALVSLAAMLAPPAAPQTKIVPSARGQVNRAPDAEMPPERLTTIEVDDMHCAACAKKIARRLFTVPGVVRVRTYLKENKALITPQEEKEPDARAMWEAVEAAGFKVVKLEGPAGKFDTKPPADDETAENQPKATPAPRRR